MTTLVALLRGINLGSNNRIAMPALREALTAAGYGHVRTYVQSGNIVLETRQKPDRLAAAIATLLADDFAVKVPVVVRAASELVEAVANNPFPEEAATNPKALQVTFRDKPLDADAVAALQARASGAEKVAARGREIYSWHPDGVARSKLALAITPRDAAATARNWTTVTTLLEMARHDG